MITIVVCATVVLVVAIICAALVVAGVTIDAQALARMATRIAELSRELTAERAKAFAARGK